MNALHIEPLTRVDYRACLQAMRAFTERRDAQTADELWLVEHDPVFTLGLNGDPSHILDAGTIPVVPTERGGQATYHGPGQLVAYPLIDIQRHGLGVRATIDALENAVIGLLGELDIDAHTRQGMPGVYINDAKVAALGLRVRRGRTLHGLALNVAMDLTPFDRINPCGYADLSITQVSAFVPAAHPASLAGPLARALAQHLGFEPLFEPAGGSPPNR